MAGNMCGEIAWIIIMKECDWARISREMFSVCKDIRTHYWRYPETPIIVHAQIEQNGLCREE